jgi:catechol 2,3-dioxygenase-like lactoylglutathione lyase family enzyme
MSTKMSSTTAIDHISLTVSDYDSAKKFYAAALRPLGWKLMMEFGRTAGFAVDGKPYLWIAEGKKTRPHIHVAFGAPTRKDVDRFYKAAIKAGATDNGKPGLRLDYHPTYYAAFVLDPDGHNIEPATHQPE